MAKYRRADPKSGDGTAVQMLIVAAVAGLVLGLIAQRIDVAFAPPPGIDSDAIVGPIFEPGPDDEPPPAVVPVAAMAGLPAYPNARPSRLGDRMVAQGVPMEAAWFSTSDAPEDVMAYYQKALGEAGLPVVSNSIRGGGAGYVGYQEKNSELMRVISVVPYMSETLVFLSNGRAGDLLEGLPTEEVPDELPHPDEAVGEMVFQLTAEDTVQHSIVARVPEGEVVALTEFYETGFEEKGWRIQSVLTSTPGEVRLEARKGDRNAQLVLKSTVENAGPEVQVFLMMTSKV